MVEGFWKRKNRAVMRLVLIIMIALMAIDIYFSLDIRILPFYLAAWGALLFRITFLRVWTCVVHMCMLLAVAIVAYIISLNSLIPVNDTGNLANFPMVVSIPILIQLLFSLHFMMLRPGRTVDQRACHAGVHALIGHLCVILIFWFVVFDLEGKFWYLVIVEIFFMLLYFFLVLTPHFMTSCQAARVARRARAARKKAACEAGKISDGKTPDGKTTETKAYDDIKRDRYKEKDKENEKAGKKDKDKHKEKKEKEQEREREREAESEKEKERDQEREWERQRKRGKDKEKESERDRERERPYKVKRAVSDTSFENVSRKKRTTRRKADSDSDDSDDQRDKRRKARQKNKDRTDSSMRHQDSDDSCRCDSDDCGSRRRGKKYQDRR